MKNTILVFLFLFAILFAWGQQNAADSLHAIKEMDMLKTIVGKHSHDTTELIAIKKLAKAYGDQWKIDSETYYIKCGLNLEKSLHEKPRKDSDEVQWLIQVASMYRFLRLDSSNLVAKKALDISRELNYQMGEWGALISWGENFRLMGDFPQAIEKLFNALRISRAIGNKDFEEVSLTFIGIAYTDLGDYNQGLYYLFQSKKMVDSLGSDMILTMPPYRLSYIGQAYEKLNMIDSALIFQQQALLLEEEGVVLKNYPSFSPLRSWILTRMGVIQTRLGNYPVALSYYSEAIQIGDVLNVGMAQYQVAELYYTLNRMDSSLHYARLALRNNEKALEKIWMLASGELLTKIFKTQNKIDSAFRYQGITLALRDSLFGPDKFHSLQLLAINEQQEQQKIAQREQENQREKERFESKIKIVALVAALGVFSLVATILYRNNRQKQKANALLESQKNDIQNALTDLKSAQRQLIQSEKMASLGELTAGIAHEIQNPLNFVNNFSEVNNELLEEMKEEIEKGNTAVAKSIANDIIGNGQKILTHGKRADSIVKGMLQHSREATGQKEPTDINALTDEYLRLSYQGARARDKAFNVSIHRNFDPAIGKINIIPQDIGRVLLNLYNNAFYAVTDKKRQLNSEYEPAVSVSTRKVGNKVEVRVHDNGFGIPQKISYKIFQPFFTTKPSGQGTGLGLSLSYDIIKAHGGEIRVETLADGQAGKEGAGFIVEIPINKD